MQSPDALMNGATAIAMNWLPETKPGKIDWQLQQYVDKIRRRVKGQQSQAMLARLHYLLFEDAGFVGNTEDYYNVANSFLPSVLATKKGLPITLSLVYKTIAERLGLHVWGIGLPGHLLVGVRDERDQTLLIDTFSGGRLLTKDETHGRLKELFGPEIQWSDEILKPITNRHWLTRILQNLLHLFAEKKSYEDVCAVLEMEMVLWPNQGHLKRELALILARIGKPRPARVWLDTYLRENPKDPQSTDLHQLLEVLSHNS